MTKKDFIKLAKNYLEKLIDLVEQDEDTESADEILEKFKNMENKINLVAILKDCPSGMELDCTMFERVEFDGIVDNEQLPIRCRIKNPDGGYNVYNFTKHGNWIDTAFAKCVIFPKGKKTWEGFQRPFKDGDIIYNRLQHKICIYYLCEDSVCINHCRYNELKNIVFEKLDVPIPIAIQDYRLATEEEKQKLFQAIKDNGYEWNAETKTLEKLIKPKFKVGDRIVNDNYIVEITDIFTNDKVYGYKSKMGGIGGILFTEQDDWELVPDKFDFTTLKPFDKVLVRDSIFGKWKIEFFEKFDKELKFPFICMNGRYSLCIPYNGNEYLHDTILPCNDYYQI